MEWEIRIEEKFTRNDYNVRLFISKNLLGLIGSGNKSKPAGHDLCFPSNCLGESKLISRRDRNFNSRHKPTRRSIDQIYANLFQAFRKLNGLLEVPSSLGPICRGDSDKNREFLRPDFTDNFRNFQRKTKSV